MTRYDEFLEIHSDLRDQVLTHLNHIEEVLVALRETMAKRGYKKGKEQLPILDESLQRINWLRDVTTGVEAGKLVLDEEGLVIQH